MAKARDFIPLLLKKAGENGYHITSGQFKARRAQELWAAVCALSHGKTPRLFIVMDPEQAERARRALVEEWASQPATDSEIPLSFQTNQPPVINDPRAFPEQCVSCGCGLTADEKWGSECPRCSESPN